MPPGLAFGGTTYKRLERAWLTTSDEAEIKFVEQYKPDLSDLLKS
jgi:hypothetical protein